MTSTSLISRRISSFNPSCSRTAVKTDGASVFAAAGPPGESGEVQLNVELAGSPRSIEHGRTHRARQCCANPVIVVVPNILVLPSPSVQTADRPATGSGITAGRFASLAASRSRLIASQSKELGLRLGPSEPSGFASGSA